MNDNLLNAIKEVSATFPNLRFGQLLENAITDYNYNANLFYLTDDELAAKLREYAKQYGI